MRKGLTLSILLTILYSTLVAMPPKPEVLESLLQAGDTARYLEMKHHHAIIQEQLANTPGRQQRIAGQAQTARPLNIAPRGLVILVNFKDVQFITPYDSIDEMINGDNYTRNYTRTYTYNGQKIKISVKSEGSARQYFIDQSWGQYQPQFDVVGPYTVSKNMSYYGQDGTWAKDKNVSEMIIDACKLADADGVDFTLYDNNNDGEIDFVYIIYAGEGQADGGADDTIWPHTYWIKDGYGKYIKLDGKYLNTYACGNELLHESTIHTGIGTFCHEFSHVLGLPDLYSTGGDTENTKLLGDWDILDSGSYNNDGNTPPAYSAYERFFMGWLVPTQISGNKDITLLPLNSGQGAALIAASTHNMIGNAPNPTTFYLIENRKKSGWDAFLPGSGMMLTKIQYNYYTWQQNSVNNTANNLGVDIIEADGITSYTSYRGKAGDLFPKGNKSYNAIANHTISAIAWRGLLTDIGFTLNNGGEAIQIGKTTTEIDATSESSSKGESFKRIENGQVVIVRGENKYNIMGQKL